MPDNIEKIDIDDNAASASENNVMQIPLLILEDGTRLYGLTDILEFIND